MRQPYIDHRGTRKQYTLKYPTLENAKEALQNTFGCKRVNITEILGNGEQRTYP